MNRGSKLFCIEMNNLEWKIKNNREQNRLIGEMLIQLREINPSCCKWTLYPPTPERQKLLN